MLNQSTHRMHPVDTINSLGSILYSVFFLTFRILAVGLDWFRNLTLDMISNLELDGLKDNLVLNVRILLQLG